MDFGRTAKVITEDGLKEIHFTEIKNGMVFNLYEIDDELVPGSPFTATSDAQYSAEEDLWFVETDCTEEGEEEETEDDNVC